MQSGRPRCSQEPHRELRTARSGQCHEPDPMPDLGKIADEEIHPIVQTNIQEEAWPWNGPTPDIDDEVKQLLQDFCSKYESGWKVPENVELRSMPS